MARTAAHRIASERRAPIERQLALEIRSFKFGYAVLEMNNLLDWGICWFPPGEPASAIDRLAFLLRVYAPAVAVARSTRRADHESSENAAQVLRKVRAELRRRSVPFAVVQRREVRKFFGQAGYVNKHEIAGAVAEQFNELKPRVPRLRKAWDPESGITPVFDAVATGIAFAAYQKTRQDHPMSTSAIAGPSADV